jgi:secondary thiamine-phosphate synthase enzyme
MKKFSVRTSSRSQLLDITAGVQSAVEAIGMASGTVTVFVPHTTAGVTINENADPDVVADILAGLDRIAPWDAGYRHCEGNSAAHIKASLMGSSARVPVDNGRLLLGTWQAIYFCEFDGPRTREVWVT